MPLRQNANYSRRKDASSNYDVFLSFRGPDTRNTFVSYLYTDLKAAGIHAFKDDDELNFGGVIAEELPRAINNSRIYMPIFSKTYASSKWCLLELAKMMEAMQFELDDGKGKEIIPVFYKVTVDDLKLKTDLFRKDLEAHRTKETKETVDGWEKALKWVTQHRGWTVDSSMGDAEFCQDIVKCVSSKLKLRRKIVAEPLFGQGHQEQRLIELLEMDSHDKVVVIGIHGMGGIGKTTLAKVVFNELYDEFDHCSFLSDVRQMLSSDNRSKDCLEMQKRLLSNVGCGSGNIDDSDDAIRAIGAQCRGKRVLIVLDDVNKENQIKNILGQCTSFGGGSRIIITTRDARTLPSKWQNVKSYEMEELKKEDALKLFSWHAFGQLSYPAEYASLCNTVVPRLTGCVPLCLEVIGSLLYGKDELMWQSTIRKLEKIPDAEIQEKLMISYEDLSDGAKEIFLDISCFFVDTRTSSVITNAVYMWEACDYFPEEGINELVSMSLIKVEERSEGYPKSDKSRMFWMHDQIKDLGREIVRREGLKDKDQCSRFWDSEEALDMLRRRTKETNNIKAVRLVQQETCNLRPDSFKNLDSLIFLELVDSPLLRRSIYSDDNLKANWRFRELADDIAQLEAGILEHLSSNLRWLSFRFATSKFKLAKKIYLNKLVVLDLSRNDAITEYWDGWKKIQGLYSLKVLDLSWCLRLRRTPDLTQCTSLERMILYGCEELVEIDRSIGNLKALKHLDLRVCKSLDGLPEEVGSLVHLEEILTSKKDEMLLIWDIKCLSKLDLGGVEQQNGLGRILTTVRNLTSLVTLHLEDIIDVALPETIGELVNLKSLSLRNCLYLKSLPDSVGRLVKLEELLLSCCRKLIGIPDSIGNMGLLKVIDVSGCRRLNKLPIFSSMQKQLQVIKAAGAALEGVPTEIQALSGLRHLNLRGTRICKLPSIVHLCHLEKLILVDCNHIKEILELPASLIYLSISSGSLPRLPDLSNLTNLKKVELIGKRDGIRFSQMLSLGRSPLCFYDYINDVKRIGRLSSELTKLTLCVPKMTTFPNDFYALSQLKKLTLESARLTSMSGLMSLSLSIFQGMASLDVTPLRNLTELSLLQCNDLVEILGLERVYALQSLHIRKCYSLEKLDNLTELKRLQFLEVTECKKLTVIVGIQHLQSLRELLIQSCHSLERLGGPSKPKNVVDEICDVHELKVQIRYCNMLNDLKGLEGLENLTDLIITGCRSLKSLFELSVLGKMELGNLQEIRGREGFGSFDELRVEDCRPREWSSNLLKLRKLQIENCNKLNEIQGLGEFKFLRSLRISRCDSLEILNFEPWMLHNMEDILIEDCKSLKDIIGIEGLQLRPQHNERSDNYLTDLHLLFESNERSNSKSGRNGYALPLISDRFRPRRSPIREQPRQPKNQHKRKM